MGICGIATAGGLLCLLYVHNADIQLGLILGCGVVALASFVMVFIRWDDEKLATKSDGDEASGVHSIKKPHTMGRALLYLAASVLLGALLVWPLRELPWWLKYSLFGVFTVACVWAIEWMVGRFPRLRPSADKR
jgi:hypothetical protein